MFFRTVSFAAILLLSMIVLAPATSARANINDMQGCQAMIMFVDGKLDTVKGKKAQVKAVRKGLNAYDRFIQNTVISPGLLEFNSGDKGKASVMQGQVDAYKSGLVAQLNKRYPQGGMFTDYAASLNNCAKKAVPSGGALEDLQAALETITALAQSR
ncbi:hypothetical protein [Robiginitomaculum antarcticum]|uniref:hypothetical protein n=1 Tax=Robiginitomaculum antarcticum TaxID=437507 RepID=UPI0003827B0D|nr:hypothetical protein [Robiginitomaculum antarcticum]